MLVISEGARLRWGWSDLFAELTSNFFGLHYTRFIILTKQFVDSRHLSPLRKSSSSGYLNWLYSSTINSLHISLHDRLHAEGNSLLEQVHAHVSHAVEPDRTSHHQIHY